MVNLTPVNKKENIGILLRVSTKVQETDGTSLDVQKKMGLEMSKKLNLDPIIFNEGSQSSFKVEINERVKLVELLDEVGRGTIKNIWVFNTDRLGRNTQSWMSIYKVLIEYGVKVFVGTSPKPFDLDNPLDNLNMNMLSLISQYDNQLRRMRSVMGKRNSLKSGNTFVGGTKPFGYDVKNKRLVINKEESECVKKMYEMYRDGKSTMEIKTYMDLKTPFKPKRSKSGWNLGTIQKILGSTLYTGKQKWEWKEKVGGKYKVVETIDVKTPKILPKKLWNDVQKRLELNSRNRDNKKKNITLFEGMLFCKSCGRKLYVRTNTNSKNDLYSCRSVEYKWKNQTKWGTKHKNCTLKKSLRIDETDQVLMDHLINILKESKRVRENFKVKSLTSKFEDVDNLILQKKKKQKYITERKNYKGKLEDTLVETELKIMMNEVSVSVGNKMKEKITELINNEENNINSLSRELSVLSKSNEWIDWLNKMYLEIDSLENLPLEKQRTFVSQHLNKINVEYLPDVKSHKFDVDFLYPIVEDEIMIDGVDKKGRRQYEVVDGKRKTTLTQKLPQQRKKNNISILKKEITKMRVVEGLSLSQICDSLNKRGILTPTKKEWDKPKLSSYIKNLKLEIDVGKV
jgi:site-specific DNA recombinase